MERSRRDVVGGLTAMLGVVGCGARSKERGTIVGRIADPTLPWNSPENEAAQQDLPLPVRFLSGGGYDLSISFDGKLMAAALPYAPANEVLIIDIASRRGWRLQHHHRRVLLTDPSFLPDGRLALLVSPPPRYLGISEIWINELSGAASSCIAGRPASLYQKPHFSRDSTTCLVFREADEAPHPWPANRPRREFREPHPGALFEVDLRTGVERRLSQRVFEKGRAYYASDRDGYYLSTSPPLIAGEPPWQGAPTPYRSPPFSEIDANEAYPFNGYFLPIGEEVSERPLCVIPDILFRADEMEGSHATLQSADYTGQLLVSYFHPHPEAASGLCNSAAFVRDGEVLRRIELGGPRLENPRMSGDGQTVAGFLGPLRENGVNVHFPNQHRPVVFVIDRVGVRTLLAITDIRFEHEAVILEPTSDAEII